MCRQQQCPMFTHSHHMYRYTEFGCRVSPFRQRTSKFVRINEHDSSVSERASNWMGEWMCVWEHVVARIKQIIHNVMDKSSVFVSSFLNTNEAHNCAPFQKVLNQTIHSFVQMNARMEVKWILTVLRIVQTKHILNETTKIFLSLSEPIIFAAFTLKMLTRQRNSCATVSTTQPKSLLTLWNGWANLIYDNTQESKNEREREQSRETNGHDNALLHFVVGWNGLAAVYFVKFFHSFHWKPEPPANILNASKYSHSI